MNVRIRAFASSDSDAILDLNAEFVGVLSPLDADRLVWLNSLADLHVVAEQNAAMVGFLLAFADGTPYDSVNYRWFAERFKRFLYIDRVVVAGSARGAGIGQALYQRAQAHALATGLAWLVCEIDVEPPNLGSLAFHERQGFIEVGRQAVGDGKIVSLQVLSIRVQ